jgi:predicted nucleic acid-binding protein
MVQRFDALSAHLPPTGTSVLVDANVLIYVFWPCGSNWEAEYSSVFKRLFKAGNPLVLDPSPLPFKQYRDSAEGHSVQQRALAVAGDILKVCKVIDLELGQADVKAMLKLEGLDFNDKILRNLCQTLDYALLTNDGDFRGTPINIISSNPTLLRN